MTSKQRGRINRARVLPLLMLRALLLTLMLIGFSRAATLSSVRLIDFGGYCDGSHSDTAALTRALQSGASTIFFPTGVCVVDAATVPSHVTLAGDAVHNTQIESQNAPVIFVVKGSRGHVLTQVTIKNFSFLNQVGPPTSGASAIVAGYVDELTVTSNTATNISLLSFGSGLAYSALTEEDISHNLQVLHNTCSSSQNRSECVDIHDLDGGLIGQNQVTGYAHGLMFWGGDARINGLLTNPHWVRHVTFSENVVTGASGGGIWGAMGQSIQMINNRVSHLGDVGLDFEGCLSSVAQGNACTDAKNGCLTAFFLNDGLVFQNNQVQQPSAEKPMGRIYNAGQTPANHNIAFKENDFECEDPQASCTLDDAGGPASEITVVGNRFHNTRLTLAFNNSNDLHVVENDFEFSSNANPEALHLQTAGQSATVFGNTIRSTASPSMALAIDVTNNDFNHSAQYVIGSNAILGFSQALTMSATGTNAGTHADFILCDNRLNGGTVRGPLPTTAAQKVTLTYEPAIDCADPSVDSATITSPPTADGQVQKAFAYTITATHAPITFGATALPTGLTVNSATGLISGTPQLSGEFAVPISAINAGSQVGRTLELHIAPGGSAVTGSLQAPNVLVYPNPWRENKSSSRITFAGLPAASQVKIFTIDGRLVKNLGTVDSKTVWDATNESGGKVASGIYVYLVTDQQGRKVRGKVAVIR